MELSQKFMKAVQTELKRAGVAMELEGGEGRFAIEGIDDSKITITVTIESHAIRAVREDPGMKENRRPGGDGHPG